ncbi:MAG: hypothetical protein JJ899_06240 [Alphaproteobacteria bacterium]|nr:hypothetical protein [Alphaproteobacteria bacterium]
MNFIEERMSSGHTRQASRRQAELDDWLSRAAAEEVVDLASLRGTMRAPTNLLQQLAEAVLDSSVSILPDGGLPELRRAWTDFEAEQGRRQRDAEHGITIVADPLAASVAAVLGLVSPGRHVAVIEPAPPQVVDAVRRVGGMARTVSMRPTERDVVYAEFAQRGGPQTDHVIVSDPNPYSGQYLSHEARAAVVAAVRHHDCHVLLDRSARASVIDEVDEDAETFVTELGDACICVDVAPASVLAGAASAAAVMGASDLVAPICSVVSTFGLGAGAVAQTVLARRFADGTAIDDAAILQGLVSSGRALLRYGHAEIGVPGLGGPGGWYVPVRAHALYAGAEDIGVLLASKAHVGVLPLAPFYTEGSSDPYILMSYVRDAGLLEDALERLSAFYEAEAGGAEMLALPSPGDWDIDDVDDVDDEAEEVESDGYDVHEHDPAVSEAREPRPDTVSPSVNERLDDRPSDMRPSFDALANDDETYRAAMAGTVESPSLSDDFGKMREADIREDSGSGEGEGRRDNVIFPFGRWRRSKRAQHLPDEAVDDAPSEPAQPSNHSQAEREEAEKAETEDVPVFKLSVPGIASPNIAVAPVREEPEPAAGQGTEEPGEKRETGPSGSEKRTRDRRDDRPFFSDDPVI